MSRACLAVAVLALLASGCLGGGSAKPSGGRGSAFTKTELVVRVGVWMLGEAPVKQTYRISCPRTSTVGDGAVTAVCSSLTGFHDSYFGTTRASLRSAGPEQAVVKVLGSVNGRSV